MRVGARVEGEAGAVEVDKVTARADAVGVSEGEKLHVGACGPRVVSEKRREAPTFVEPCRSGKKGRRVCWMRV